MIKYGLGKEYTKNGSNVKILRWIGEVNNGKSSCFRS